MTIVYLHHCCTITTFFDFTIGQIGRITIPLFGGLDQSKLDWSGGPVVIPSSEGGCPS